MKMNNKGFTLVEVMAGFSLLVVLMVSFVKIINISSDLITAAVDTKEKTSDFYKSYFSGRNYYTAIKNNASTNNDKPAFRLSTENAIEFQNEDGTINTEINIVEVFDYGEEGKKYSAPFELSKEIKLKRIENVYDYNISRICVFRYVSN